MLALCGAPVRYDWTGARATVILRHGRGLDHAQLTYGPCASDVAERAQEIMSTCLVSAAPVPRMEGHDRPGRASCGARRRSTQWMTELDARQRAARLVAGHLDEGHIWPHCCRLQLAITLWCCERCANQCIR